MLSFEMNESLFATYDGEYQKLDIEYVGAGRWSRAFTILVSIHTTILPNWHLFLLWSYLGWVWDALDTISFRLGETTSTAHRISLFGQFVGYGFGLTLDALWHYGEDPPNKADTPVFSCKLLPLTSFDCCFIVFVVVF